MSEAGANHHREAFLRQYLAMQDDLRAVTHALVRDRHQAEDIFQEVSLVLWRKFEDYDPQRASFATWARGIATREVLRQHRLQQRGGRVLSPAAIAAIAEASTTLAEEQPYSDELAALRTCISQLDARAQQLLRLRYQDALPIDDIAEQTRRGKEAVGKALQRLRSALLQCVAGRLNRSQA